MFETSKKYRIVVSDDEPVIRMNIIEILEHAGHEVVAEADDGFRAMEACRKHMPDIALLDVKMPVLDGLAAAHYIYEQQLCSTIIMLTAYHDLDLVKKAVNCGATGYLIKPVTERSLLPCIEVAVARSRDISVLKDEVQRSKQDMASRKTIERAKGLLMDKHHMSEQQAYDYIRKLSKEQSISLQKVSEMLLMSSM